MPIPIVARRWRPRIICLLLTLSVILAAFLTALTIMNRLGADRWWFGALNLYLPQAIWAIPGILLTVTMWAVNRRLVWAPLICVVWVFGPLMGFTWSRQTAPEPGLALFRIMTCNVKYGSRSLPALFAEIDRCRPDLVLLQDATGLLDSPAGAYFRKWNIRSYGQYVIAGAMPLEEAEVEWLNFPGMVERQACLRCRFRIAGRVVTLYNVHLHSPREALSLVTTETARPAYRDFVATRLADNATSRYIQTYRLAALLDRDDGPVIVAGDLNAPDTSLVCATLRDAGMHDAFAEGGRGYGYTYGHFLIPEWPLLPKFSFVRIDHVMMSSDLRAVRCWSGTAAASDHRPVYADLVVR